MPIRDRVNDVLQNWCGVEPDDQTIKLCDLWVSTRNNVSRPHDGIDFQPDGVRDLLAKLRAEFEKPGPVRKDVSGLSAGSFKPNGDVDTVDDLVEAVVDCPSPAEVTQ